MADDDFKNDLRHFQDKVTQVQVAVGQIDAKTEESARRLQTIESDIKHAAKNLAFSSSGIALIGQKIAAMDADIKQLDAEKADKKDVDSKIDGLNKRVDAIENSKKKTTDFLTANVFKIIFALLGTVGAYLSAKLGLGLVP